MTSDERSGLTRRAVLRGAAAAGAASLVAPGAGIAALSSGTPWRVQPLGRNGRGRVRADRRATAVRARRRRVGRAGGRDDRAADSRPRRRPGAHGRSRRCSGTARIAARRRGRRQRTGSASRSGPAPPTTSSCAPPASVRWRAARISSHLVTVPRPAGAMQPPRRRSRWPSRCSTPAPASHRSSPARPGPGDTRRPATSPCTGRSSSRSSTTARRRTATAPARSRRSCSRSSTTTATSATTSTSPTTSRSTPSAGSGRRGPAGSTCRSSARTPAATTRSRPAWSCSARSWTWCPRRRRSARSSTCWRGSSRSTASPRLGRVTVEVAPDAAFYTRFAPGAHVSLPRVAGHRDGDETSCPGNAFYARLPSMRPQVAQLAGSPARATIAAPPRPSTAGTTVTVTGLLTDLASAVPLAGAPIELQQIAPPHSEQTIATAHDRRERELELRAHARQQHRSSARSTGRSRQRSRTSPRSRSRRR